MSTDVVSLCWNDFESCIFSAVSDLRNDDILCDVTLVCDDGEIQAHRVILSACSQFFSDVVRKTHKHNHPMLYIRGASTRILNNILDYMYLGTANILEQDLPDLLSLASDLKIYGLITSLEELDDIERYGDGCSISKEITETKKEVTDEEVRGYERSVEDINKKENSLLVLDFPEDGHTEEDGCREEEEPAVPGFQDEDSSMKDMYLHFPPQDVTNKDETLDKMLDRIVIRIETEFGGVTHQCTVCNKTEKRKVRLRRHAETHVIGYKNQCSYCGRFFKTRYSFVTHVKNHKNGI